MSLYKMCKYLEKADEKNHGNLLEFFKKSRSIYKEFQSYLCFPVRTLKKYIYLEDAYE